MDNNEKNIAWLLAAVGLILGVGSLRADDLVVVMPTVILCSCILIGVILRSRGKTRTLAFVALVGLIFICWRDWKEATSKQLPASAIKITAMYVGVGNMPERHRATTWDQKPWDEEHYSDVRLKITNSTDYLLQNLNIKVGFPNNLPNFVIPAIGQLSDIPGVEFHGEIADDVTIRLRGKDGNSYNVPFPFSKMILPSRVYKVFTPRLEPHETLELIVGVAALKGLRTVPSDMQINGTSETTAGEGSKSAQIDEQIAVLQ